MAGTEGTTPNASKKPGKLRYFFLDVEEHGGPALHKTLHINRAADTIITWCYPLGKRIVYTYSYTKKYREPAFETAKVNKMLNRGWRSVMRIISEGQIERPPYVYTLDERKRMVKYMWHEKNILEAHDFYSNTHFGRPRRDGFISPAPIPNAREIRALIRQEHILYVHEDGEFKPVWRAKDLS